MGTIKLEGSAGCSDTIVSNIFIDEYMPGANGEFVKIYLYLLRSLSVHDADISVCRIADVFNHTEKDVLRALKYWEQAGLLDLCFDSEKTLTNIIIKPLYSKVDTPDTSAVHNVTAATVAAQAISVLSKTPIESAKNTKEGSIPAEMSSSDNKQFIKHTYTANELKEFKSQNEVIEFTYLAEKYLGKTLNGSDINSLLFIYDVLGFSAELIGFLLEYCVTNGHKSMRYIEKVALSWAENDIDTVDKARANTDLFNKSCYPVLKAFGLNGRNPGKAEKEFIIKWTNTYGFNMDIILEACNRTISSIHEPSFKYADSILSNWKKTGVKTLAQIKVLDKEHKSSADKQPPSHRQSNNTQKSKNSFNNFEQRSYDYDELEKTLFENM